MQVVWVRYIGRMPEVAVPLGYERALYATRGQAVQCPETVAESLLEQSGWVTADGPDPEPVVVPPPTVDELDTLESVAPLAPLGRKGGKKPADEPAEEEVSVDGR